MRWAEKNQNLLDSLLSAHRMHDFTDFRQPNFTKFEHNMSRSVFR